MTAAFLAGTMSDGATAMAETAAARAAAQRPLAGKEKTQNAAPAQDGLDPEDQALLDQMQRDLLADIAAFDEDEEVREAARVTLKKAETGDKKAVEDFFDHGQQDAKKAAKDRKDRVDAENRKLIEALVGTGGPAFNAAVTLALQKDARERANFLAFGRDIAAEQDRRDGAYEKELKDRRRAHVQAAAAQGTPEVSKAAKAALAAGDAAIEDYLKTGYLIAAKKDADARDAQLAELERQRKENEAASAEAQKIVRAMKARRNILTAHGDGLKALERAANDMTGAADASREAARVLAADQASGQYHPELYQRAKDRVAQQLQYAIADAREAETAAAGATTQANILVENGMPHGLQWVKVVQGMAAAAQAGKQATESAVHAVDAIAADAAATDAADKAKKHEENAKQWLANAKSHEASALQMAKAARDEANAAADAARLAKQARIDAEAALASAKVHAANVKQARADAENQRTIAAQKRQEAEQWRGVAEQKRKEAEAKQQVAAQERAKAVQEANLARQKRQEAEAQQRIASDKRVAAQQQEQIAADAAKDARAQEQIAANADNNASTEENRAHQAREEAEQLRQTADTAEKRAQALGQLADRAESSSEIIQEDKVKARNAANQARTDANTARGAANTAQQRANEAGTAAANSRKAATEAQGAAGRSRAHADRAQSAASEARAAAREAEHAAGMSRAAANQAQAAASRANQAANRAEQEAAAVHAEAMRARADAETATAAEARAAESARKAMDLAQRAMVESAKALEAADRTRDEANAASEEAATAAVQAGIATRASAATTKASAGIANPANTAITLTNPFAGTDIDADFVQLVANRAKDIGDTQVKAAQQAAADANQKSIEAAEAARNAGDLVKPAYEAAANAAKSAADAAKAAAEAQVSAADAAVEAAAARRIAAETEAVDAEAQADAKAARAAADQAAADAALAGRAADQAERDAAAARQAADSATRAANEATAAANRAQQDADAAARAATQAEKDAEEARQAAARADQYAKDADSAAKNAEKYADNVEARARNAEADAKAIQAQLAQLQEEMRRAAEEQERREAEQAIADDSEVPALTPEEEADLRAEKGQAGVDQYNQARAEANKSLLDMIVAEGGQIILDLIGYTDAKKCFMEGDFISCVMTVINALPILKLARFLTKIPDAISTTVRIVKGIRTFKDLKVAARGVITKLRDLLKQLKGCKQPGMRAAAGCSVVDRQKIREKELEAHKGQPSVSPNPGQRLSSIQGQQTMNGCFNTIVPTDVSFNYPMQDFTWLGNPAKRATGGIVCAKGTTTRSGEPAPPVGHPESPAKLGTEPVQKGHLVAARLWGSMSVENIVTQYRAVNLSDVKIVENAVGDMLDRHPARDVSVIYEVHVQYPSATAAMPEWIFIEAISSNGANCFATIHNVPGGNVNKERCDSFRTA
ncbi:DNA/RNA non-specific endonuclease [Amycolatopsis sp. cg5]|uniref:DNA/RNA non-specific endonuclease n=1 Tax=Amycolatopsis sp. cg5 TaxID=3238802 RepID=UPI003524F648